ncbi:MAG: lipopolysaccharide biosynthesis protein [Bacteroidales bacterium]|nr:lipopolysaccharide biosynthesis protein [Candidatus Cacconaster merdequi]
MGIFDALCRLAGAFLISVSPFDRLIFYGILLTAVSLIFRIVYGVYCRIHFAESKYAFMFDKSLFREMFGFAGWSFLTNTAWIFNTQGVSMLVNVYFGVVVNAARSVAAQVEGAVMQFVNNFTVAFNPQITKSYASDDKERMFYLINKGSRFSFFLFLFFAIPVYFEADFILSLWLKVVPENAVSFVRLSLIALIPNLIGNTGYVACMATGNIRKYTVLLTTIACTSFFITWIAFYSGLAPQSTYVIFAVVYAFVEVARLIMMKQLLNFQIMTFVKDVIAKCTIVLALACIVPFFVTHCLEQSWYRLIITVISGFLSSAAIMYFIGMSYGERNTLKTALVSRIRSHKFQNHF